MRAASRFAAPALLASLLLAAGCASDRAPQPASRVSPDTELQAVRNPAASTRLGAFPKVEIKAVTVTGGSNSRAEDDLARRIDAELFNELQPLWRNTVRVPRGVAFTAPAQDTLLIEPTIEETKIPSRVQREFLTWGAGDSYVLVKVVFRDGTTGQPIAEPVFFRKADLFSASWSGGIKDIELARLVTSDVVAYTRDNL